MTEQRARLKPAQPRASAGTGLALTPKAFALQRQSTLLHLQGFLSSFIPRDSCPPASPGISASPAISVPLHPQGFLLPPRVLMMLWGLVSPSFPPPLCRVSPRSHPGSAFPCSAVSPRHSKSPDPKPKGSAHPEPIPVCSPSPGRCFWGHGDPESPAHPPCRAWVCLQHPRERIFPKSLL